MICHAVIDTNVLVSALLTNHFVIPLHNKMIKEKIYGEVVYGCFKY